MKIKKAFNNNVFMLKRVFWYCPKYAAITVLSALLASGLAVLNVYFLKVIVDAVSISQNNSSAVLMIILYTLINIFIKTCLSFISTYFSPKYLQLLQKGFQLEVLQKASTIPFDYIDDASYYDKFTIAMQQSDARLVALINTLTNIITSLFSISSFVAIVVSYKRILIIYILTAVFIAIFFNLYLSKTSYLYTINSIPIQRKINYSKRIVYLRDFSQDLHLNQSFSDLIVHRLKNNIISAIGLIKEFGVKIGAIQSVIAMLPMILQAVAMFYAIHGILRGIFSLGEFVLISNSCINLFNQMNLFSTSLYQLYEHSLYIDNYKEFLEFPCENDRFGSLNIPAVINYSFNNISFKYRSSNKQVFENINFEIEQGERIILSGVNGTGKSTLVKLICGLYLPTQGEILINGVAINNYDIKQYRKVCHLVSQNVSIFAASIAENILMRPLQGEEDKQIVWAALEQVEMDQKVKELPNNIYSEVTREFDRSGVIFSGGELQRIALARVFAGNFSTIILDEATNQVDKSTETNIYQRLFDKKHDSTIIIISHRADNISGIDKVLILNDQGGINCEKKR